MGSRMELEHWAPGSCFHELGNYLYVPAHRTVGSVWLLSKILDGLIFNFQMHLLLSRSCTGISIFANNFFSANHALSCWGIIFRAETRPGQRTIFYRNTAMFLQKSCLLYGFGELNIMGHILRRADLIPSLWVFWYWMLPTVDGGLPHARSLAFLYFSHKICKQVIVLEYNTPGPVSSKSSNGAFNSWTSFQDLIIRMQSFI